MILHQLLIVLVIWIWICKIWEYLVIRKLLFFRTTICKVSYNWNQAYIIYLVSKVIFRHRFYARMWFCWLIFDVSAKILILVTWFVTNTVGLQHMSPSSMWPLYNFFSKNWQRQIRIVVNKIRLTYLASFKIYLMFICFLCEFLFQI